MFVSKRKIRNFIEKEYDGMIEYQAHYSTNNEYEKGYKDGVIKSYETMLNNLKNKIN
jgi:hypothetical protein